MRSPFRVFFIVLAISITACADASSVTGPVNRSLKAPAPRLDVIDSSMCRSGYNITQGRCN